MGLGDGFKGFFGITSDERQQASENLAKAKYEALERTKKIEAAAAAELQQLHLKQNEQKSEMDERAAAAQMVAHAEKLASEKEKMEMLKNANDLQMRMMTEQNERLRQMERENNDDRRENEKQVRLAEARAREEHENKRELERIEAKAREDRIMKEATEAMNISTKSVLDMKDQTFAEMNRLTVDTQKQRDELVKENMQAIEARDNKNAEKLEKLTANYNTQVKEAKEQAQDREDRLRAEKDKIDADYKTAMEKRDQISKEDRERITAEYQSRVEAKDAQLSEHRREVDAKVDGLHRHHQEDLRRNHEECLKMQENHRKEVDKLHLENQRILQESASQQDEANRRMLEMTEKKNEQLMLVASRTLYTEAKKMKENSEYLRISNSDKELAPLAAIRQELTKTVTEGCVLWSMHNEKDGTATAEVKGSIIEQARLVPKTIGKLIELIDACRSIGEQKSVWKRELTALDEAASAYAKSVAREIRLEGTTMARFYQLEDQAEALKKQVYALTDMVPPSLEAAMERNATDAIATAEKEGVSRALLATSPQPAPPEGSKGADNLADSEPLVEEP